MTNNPFINRYRMALLILVLLVAAILSLALYASSVINRQDMEILSKETVINLYQEELNNRQASILEQSNQLSDFGDQVNNLEGQIESLEFDIESRVCQSVSYEEFDRRVRLGTSYVITPEKMGWPGYWTIREDVLFERENVLARGYEFRYDLTPDNYSDDWQEIHTTIRLFESSEAAKSFFESKGTKEGNVYFETSLNLGIPVKIWRGESLDRESGLALSMYCEYFQFDIKTKYIEETSLAIRYLEEAAIMLISDISVWVP